MIGTGKKIGLLTALLLLACVTSVGATDISALTPTSHKFSGNVTIGGTDAPVGTVIYAQNESATTTNATVTTAGEYIIYFNFGAGESGTTNVSIYVGSVSNDTYAYSEVVQKDLGTTKTNLAIAASCSDGIQNGNETYIDCGGDCTACYSLSVSPTTVSKTILPNASATQVLTITNNGVYAVAGLAVSAPTLAGGNITINFTAPSTTLAASASTTVTLNISAASGTVASTTAYTGTINVTATNSTSNGTVAVSVITSEAQQLRRRTRYMEWSIVGGVEADRLCIGEPVVVTVKRQNDQRAVKSVDVDVYYGGKKVFNLMTDDDGVASFTPEKAGAYTVTGQRTRYKDLEEIIEVLNCEAVVETTTTVEVEETTTVAPKPTTTVKPKPTTTVKKPTTTVAPRPTTTVAPKVVEKKGLPWTTIIIVLIVVIVVVAVLAKKGGGEAAPAEEAPTEPAEEAPAEEGGEKKEE